MISRAVAFMVVCAACAAGPARAQSWVDRAFPERAFDFGTVARGSKIHHTFRLINTTVEEIRIADTRTKCGCTDVKIGGRDITPGGHNQIEVPPGTQIAIEAVIDTTKFQGYKASGLTLVLDRPSFLEIDLNLTCFILGEVLASPGQVDFGVVSRGSPTSQTLTLTYAGGDPAWAITKMQTITAFVTAKLQLLGRTPEGYMQYQLKAELSPKAPSGSFRDEITLFTTNPQSPTIPIAVAANVQAGVTVSPSILNLGRVKPGAVVKKTVLVRATKPFQVVGTKAAKGEITASETSGQPRAVHPMTVTIKAPGRGGASHAVLEIETDLKNEPPARVSTFATVVP